MPDVLVNLARLYLARREDQRARELLEEAGERIENMPAYLILKGLAEADPD